MKVHSYDAVKLNLYENYTILLESTEGLTVFFFL